ncbi:MAG: M28 family peptidase [Desulfobacterales bacterium]|nr:M28 family peptidase [Desulfobacterales bacterium]
MILEESIKRLQETVRYLSVEIGPRSYNDYEKLCQAAEYISSRFKEYGYNVNEQPFVFQGKTYRNIIGNMPGLNEEEEILVLGAHYDTVSGSPGADDNASAVAGLLEVARLVSKSRVAPAIQFVAFALEEPPAYRTKNMGSYHYAQMLNKGRHKVFGMICLEMIGYFVDRPHSQEFPLPFMEKRFSDKGNFIAAVGNLRSRKFTEMVKEGFKEGTDIPIFSYNALPIVIGIDLSDHWSFYQFGYPAVMITDTAFYRNPYYHTAKDIHDTLDYEKMAKVVYGVKAAIERLV